MGYSEAGPLPRTAEQFAKELHTLLHQANIPGPYVLVGHSLGGLPVRVFTHRYPAEVVGVVLIESMSPQQSQRATTDITPQPASDSSGSSILSLAARLGVMRLLAGPLGFGDDLPPDVAKAYTAFSVTPRYFQTVEDEGAGIPESLTQADAVTTFGDLPLIVLSRGLDQDQE